MDTHTIRYHALSQNIRERPSTFFQGATWLDVPAHSLQVSTQDTPFEGPGTSSSMSDPQTFVAGGTEAWHVDIPGKSLANCFTPRATAALGENRALGHVLIKRHPANTPAIVTPESLHVPWKGEN